MDLLNVMTRRYGGLVLILVVSASPRAFSQFSPGDLSRAHAHLEGTTNCARCHEVGKEISGRKCLACHTEIAAALRRAGGFHATVTRTSTCVTCHKEHLGREARTTTVVRRTFDHAATGFPLGGKHAAASCEACHAAKNIRDKAILKLIREKGRKSFLGLDAGCASCHADRHERTLGTDCGSCHVTSAWVPATGFNHATTRFPLTGLHAPVACERCHDGMKTRTAPLLFTGKPFKDCTP